MDENIYKERRRPQASQPVQSQWVDQPRPSGGYICFCLFFPLLLLLIVSVTLIRIHFVTDASSFILNSVVFAFLFIAFVVIFGLILRTGYRIKYVLDERILQLNVGSKTAFSVPLQQISKARKSVYNRRLIGWGIGTAGLCNRFSNGVCLTVTKGRGSYQLYLSPSDPDAFLARLNEHRQIPIE